MNMGGFDKDNRPFLFLDGMPALKKYTVYKRFSVFLISLFLILMILSSTYLYVQNSKSVNKILVSRESTLNEELTKIENINDILEAEIMILKNEAKTLSHQNEQKKLKKISKYLADTVVTGSGVEIVLKDSYSIFLPVQDEKTIVHNTDLLKIVNFLWSSGAAAICINDERIVLNSHISCAGPTILLNKKRISSPFVIKAVGEKLNADEIKNNAFMLSLKLRGIEFELIQRDNLVIPAGKYATFME